MIINIIIIGEYNYRLLFTTCGTSIPSYTTVPPVHLWTMFLRPRPSHRYRYFLFLTYTRPEHPESRFTFAPR